MNRKEYSAGAVKHSFWFMEFRKVVSLRLEGKTWEETATILIQMIRTQLTNWMSNSQMECFGLRRGYKKK